MANGHIVTSSGIFKIGDTKNKSHPENGHSLNSSKNNSTRGANQTPNGKIVFCLNTVNTLISASSSSSSSSAANSQSDVFSFNSSDDVNTDIAFSPKSTGRGRVQLSIPSNNNNNNYNQISGQVQGVSSGGSGMPTSSPTGMVPYLDGEHRNVKNRPATVQELKDVFQSALKSSASDYAAMQEAKDKNFELIQQLDRIGDIIKKMDKQSKQKKESKIKILKPISHLQMNLQMIPSYHPVYPNGYQSNNFPLKYPIINPSHPSGINNINNINGCPPGYYPTPYSNPPPQIMPPYHMPPYMGPYYPPHQVGVRVVAQPNGPQLQQRHITSNSSSGDSSEGDMSSAGAVKVVDIAKALANDRMRKEFERIQRDHRNRIDYPDRYIEGISDIAKRNGTAADLPESKWIQNSK